MARIRTIKPEFWTDEKIVELSIPARLFFIGLWNHADDAGNMFCSPRKLKMQIFPADNIDCDALLRELITHGLIIEYSVNHERLIHIKGFKKHQVINRPSKSTIPPPEKREDTPPLTEHSRMERKGREGKYIYKPSDSETLPCAEPVAVGGRDDFGMADQNAAIEKIRTTVWRQHGATDDQIATKRASASAEGVRQVVAWLKLLDAAAICAAVEDAYSAAESRGEKIRNPWAYLDAVIKAAASAAATPEPAEVLDRSHGGRTLVEWETSVSIFQKNGFWHGPHGPKPGEAGCRVPQQVLVKAGLA